jgi:hypothetical protein
VSQFCHHLFFLDDVLEPYTTIYYKFYNLTSVTDPVGIAILFWTLRQHLYHIIVNELSSNNSLALAGHSQQDLFQAQEGIYSKVAHVFKGAATVKLVSAWLPVIVDCTKLQ